MKRRGITCGASSPTGESTRAIHQLTHSLIHQLY